MPDVTRLLRPVVLSAVAAIALSGCTGGGDDAQPAPSSAVSSSTVSSSSGSPTAPNTANVPSGVVSPTEPATARADSAAGASDFVRYYWAQLNWAYSTVDGDTLTGLYRPTCTTCESSRTGINGVRDAGRTYRGGHLSITSQVPAPDEQGFDADYAVKSAVTVEPLTVLAGDGSTVTSYPGKSYRILVYVARVDDHFEVAGTLSLDS